MAWEATSLNARTPIAEGPGSRASTDCSASMRVQEARIPQACSSGQADPAPTDRASPAEPGLSNSRPRFFPTSGAYCPVLECCEACNVTEIVVYEDEPIVCCFECSGCIGSESSYLFIGTCVRVEDEAGNNAGEARRIQCRTFERRVVDCDACPECTEIEDTVISTSYCAFCNQFLQLCDFC